MGERLKRGQSKKEERRKKAAAFFLRKLLSERESDSEETNERTSKRIDEIDWRSGGKVPGTETRERERERVPACC